MRLEMLNSLSRRLTLRSVPSVEEAINVFKDSGLSYEVIGRGWCGDPIYMFRAGEGSRRILLVGMVDPDEPVGLLALRSLVTEVFDQEPSSLSRCAWFIVPVADPCGARLNEGWFRDLYDIKLYILERFKVKAVEWRLPGSCGDYMFNEPTPEALAVKRAIDIAGPDAVIPLHNNDFSGLYFFLSRNVPELISNLKNAARKLGIPIHRGEPEAPYLEVFEEGFYREPTICDEYRNCVEHAPNPKACLEGLGETIYGYAKKANPNVFSITCETPYIYSRVLENNTPSGNSLRDAYLRMIDTVEPIAEYVEHVARKLIPQVSTECPYLWEAEEYLLGWRSKLESLRRRVMKDKLYCREASKAEEFDITVVKGLWNTLLKLGIALRLLSRCGEGIPSINIDEVITELTNMFENLNTKLHQHPIEHIPLEKQVLMQLHTILLTTESFLMSNTSRT